MKTKVSLNRQYQSRQHSDSQAPTKPNEGLVYSVINLYLFCSLTSWSLIRLIVITSSDKMITLRTILILWTAITAVTCISVPLDKFHPLINDRCFNETYDRKPLTLGQNYPVGLSVENLISLIEKIETKLPQLNAQQIILLLLKR